MSYPKLFKENAVAKALSPGAGSKRSIAKELGIPPTTLLDWIKKYANAPVMKRTKDKSIHWSAEQKLEAVIKTSSMSENEIGEYLRANGLHSNDLETFKKELISSVPGKGRPKLDPEVVELRKANKQLKRDLSRNKSALAEQSARIILLKKSHEIWGEPEDEE